MDLIGGKMESTWMDGSASACYCETTMDYYQHPFDQASVWNIPVIELHAAYQPIPTLEGVPVGLSSWLRPDTTSVAIYKSDKNTPLHSVFYNSDAWNNVASGEWKRFGNRPEVEAVIRATSRPKFPESGNVFSSQSGFAWRLPDQYARRQNPEHPPARFRFPSGIRPPEGTDGHVAVWQPDGTVFEGYATIALSDGDLVCLTYGVTRANGNGDGAANGVTASMIPDYAGLLRDKEVATGRVEHAISIKVPGNLLKADFVYPAYAFDRDALIGPQPYDGEIPMGARLALPANLKVSALNLKTEFGHTVATAGQRYGFIIVDRGGEGITIDDEARPRDPALATWSAERQRDLQTIFSHLEEVVPASAR